MTKHDAMKAFFEPKVMEMVGDLLNVNFSPECNGSVTFITNYSDKVLKQFIRGNARKEYGFSIVITKPYSVEGDDLNLEAMNFAQAFMDWMDEQNRKKNYPAFPGNCRIIRMENLQNMPNLAGVNPEVGLARYMMQCRLIYDEYEVIE